MRSFSAGDDPVTRTAGTGGLVRGEHSHHIGGNVPHRSWPLDHGQPTQLITVSMSLDRVEASISRRSCFARPLCLSIGFCAFLDHHAGSSDYHQQLRQECPSSSVSPCVPPAKNVAPPTLKPTLNPTLFILLEEKIGLNRNFEGEWKVRGKDLWEKWGGEIVVVDGENDDEGDGDGDDDESLAVEGKKGKRRAVTLKKPRNGHDLWESGLWALQLGYT